VTHDPDLYGDDALAARLLRETDVWVVAGLSSNQARDAYGVARLLQSRGKRIVPVHPRAETVHGETGYASVTDASFSVGPIDVVDCFVNSRRVGEVVDDAIAIGAKAVWLQLGIIDEGAARRARAAGLGVIMDRCPAIEYRTNPLLHG
jgi:predicted CoA-binding protein